MDVLGWLWWFLSGIVSATLSLVWFLLSGWVSTLLQIAFVVVVIYFLKYGWQRAPPEIWRRSRSFACFFLGWIRARDAPGSHGEPTQAARVVRVKEFGDINVSTLLSLLAIVGLALVANLPQAK